MFRLEVGDWRLERSSRQDWRFRDKEVAGLVRPGLDVCRKRSLYGREVGAESVIRAALELQPPAYRLKPDLIRLEVGDLRLERSSRQDWHFRDKEVAGLVRPGLDVCRKRSLYGREVAVAGFMPAIRAELELDLPPPACGLKPLTKGKP